jgi:hypothetical protein
LLLGHVARLKIAGVALAFREYKNIVADGASFAERL